MIFIGLLCFAFGTITAAVAILTSLAMGGGTPPPERSPFHCRADFCKFRRHYAVFINHPPRGFLLPRSERIR
jgi:hypothetical protein